MLKQLQLKCEVLFIHESRELVLKAMLSNDYLGPCLVHVTRLILSFMIPFCGRLFVFKKLRQNPHFNTRKKQVITVHSKIILELISYLINQNKQSYDYPLTFLGLLILIDYFILAYNLPG